MVIHLQYSARKPPIFHVGTVKDGCLSSRQGGMEACTQLLREIFSPEVIHTTLYELLSICIGAAGLLLAVIDLILKIIAMKKK